jgi:hypothetical protein
MLIRQTSSKKIQLTLLSSLQLFRLLWQSPARLSCPLISATTTHKYMIIEMHNALVSAELTIKKQVAFTGYSHALYKVPLCYKKS